MIAPLGGTALHRLHKAAGLSGGYTGPGFGQSFHYLGLIDHAVTTIGIDAA
jgi:hypothetical protein